MIKFWYNLQRMASVKCKYVKYYEEYLFSKYDYDNQFIFEPIIPVFFNITSRYLILEFLYFKHFFLNINNVPNLT